MKTTRFTTEQIIGVLKEAEAGMPIKELCRKHGMSDATLYNWKSKYGGDGRQGGLMDFQVKHLWMQLK